MANRYPTGDATGILAAIRADSGIFHFLGCSQRVTFQVTAAATPAQCQFTYTNTANPAVVSPSTTTAC